MSAYGSDKLNVLEVARLAGVARTSVYKHFGTKERLFEAAESQIEEQMLELLSEEASRFGQLHERAAAVASCIRRARTDRSNTPWFGFMSPLDEAAILVTRAGDHIRRLTGVLRPLVVEARNAGEIRASLDADRTAEWIARICLTFVLGPASLNIDDPAEVRRFFREHLRGLG